MPRKKKLSNEAKGDKTKTIAVRQEKAKALFLEQVRESPFVSHVAKAAGIDRSTYYRWRKEDKEFRREVDRLQSQAREKINDVMESVLIREAQNGNLTAIIFWLKHNHQMYANKLIVTHEEMSMTKEEMDQVLRVIKDWQGISAPSVKFKK